MKCLAIINPISGKGRGRSIYKRVLPILNNACWEIDLFITQYKGHFLELAMKDDLNKYEAVIIVGGDGSLNEFVNGLMHRKDHLKIPIGLIAAGTGNSLMRDLDLLDPLKAVDSIVKEGLYEIDLAKIRCENKTYYAFNVIGWGLPSTINQKSERWKWLGGQRYNAASLQEIFRNPNWPVTLNFGGTELKGNYSFFLACNTIHTGNGMRIAPRAVLDDGLFDLVLLKQASRAELIRLFMKIFKGQHIDHPLVEYHQVDAFSVDDQVSSTLILDGQIAGMTPFTVKVLHKELPLLNVPEEILI